MLSLLPLLVVLSSCSNDDVNAHGPVINEERELNAFSSIVVDLPAQVFITDQPGQSVRVQTHQNLLSIVETSVNGSTLSITSSYNLRNAQTLNIFLSADDYERLQINGAGTIITQNCIDVDNLEVRINGAGAVNLCGNTGDLRLDISGAGKIEAFGMQATTANIQLSGASEVQTSVTDQLTVSISGAGLVSYMGDPEVISNINGAGVIRRTN